MSAREGRACSARSSHRVTSSAERRREQAGATHCWERRFRTRRSSPSRGGAARGRESGRGASGGWLGRVGDVHLSLLAAAVRLRERRRERYEGAARRKAGGRPGRRRRRRGRVGLVDRRAGVSSSNGAVLRSASCWGSEVERRRAARPPWSRSALPSFALADDQTSLATGRLAHRSPCSSTACSPASHRAPSPTRSRLSVRLARSPRSPAPS